MAYSGLPKLISVDVARFGDDRSVIFCRQGRRAYTLAKLRGPHLDLLSGAGLELVFPPRPMQLVAVNEESSRGFNGKVQAWKKSC